MITQTKEAVKWIPVYGCSFKIGPYSIGYENPEQTNVYIEYHTVSAIIDKKDFTSYETIQEVYQKAISGEIETTIIGMEG